MNTHLAAAPPASVGNEKADNEELKTPMIKHSNGYPQLNLMSSSVNKNDRSISTGLKPATAVRLKSLPWNFQPINYEVATTATSHSRRTTDKIPLY